MYDDYGANGFMPVATNLNENIEWWWPGLPSPMITWIVGSLAFAVVAAALFFVEDRRPTEITQPGQGHGG